jgi:hypothetical protein
MYTHNKCCLTWNVNVVVLDSLNIVMYASLYLSYNEVIYTLKNTGQN